MINHILIVDDSAMLRRAVRRVVKMSGICAGQVFEAENGQEALDCLDTISVDLVLLDLHMPVMDGETFLEKFSEQPNASDTRVVIVSTEASQERLARLRELGAVGSLAKPFEPEALREIVQQIVEVQP